jgi:hypothetical protein
MVRLLVPIAIAFPVSVMSGAAMMRIEFPYRRVKCE